MSIFQATGKPLAVVLLLTCCSVPAAAAGAEGGGNAEVRIRHPENFCVGGIEDGKFIVDEQRLSDPFRETTRLGCQVDGGTPRTMPDLPAPSPELRLRV
ncbi:MAG: hypothetical protein U5Q16_08285 [Gammaproteobacteria bacterium]|nr:hypothetical protein [Gammaproteobacteria bacterium]